MERRVTTSSDGHPLLILSGEAGAASVVVRQAPDGAYGVMDFCSRTPVREGQPAQQCHVMGLLAGDRTFPNGFCYPLCPGFRAGVDVARLWDAGSQAQAWAVMEEWYAAQLGGPR